MSLFNEDRDAGARMEEQERFMEFNGHDHTGPVLLGWRAERDHATRLGREKGAEAQKDRAQIRKRFLHRISGGLRRLVWNF